VPEWAFPTGVELTTVEGDVDVALGVRVVATPGHTPGHQSVVVDGGDGTRTIVCCQAAWDVASFGAGTLGDEGWDEVAGAASVRKLHALSPDRVVLSHDPEEWRRR
jgi:4-pyridoxolactonase